MVQISHLSGRMWVKYKWFIKLFNVRSGKLTYDTTKEKPDSNYSNLIAKQGFSRDRNNITL